MGKVPFQSNFKYTFSDSNHIHNVLQLSPASIPKTFSSLETETVYPVSNNSLFLSPLQLR